MTERQINHIIRHCIKRSSKLYNKFLDMEQKKKMNTACQINNARFGEIQKYKKWVSIRKEEYGY